MNMTLSVPEVLTVLVVVIAIIGYLGVTKHRLVVKNRKIEFRMGNCIWVVEELFRRMNYYLDRMNEGGKLVVITDGIDPAALLRAVLRFVDDNYCVRFGDADSCYELLNQIRDIRVAVIRQLVFSAAYSGRHESLQDTFRDDVIHKRLHLETCATTHAEKAILSNREDLIGLAPICIAVALNKAGSHQNVFNLFMSSGVGRVSAEKMPGYPAMRDVYVDAD